jgi:dynein heavy chain
MLVGFAGTGKSVLAGYDHIFRAISFNYYTTSQILQTFLESSFEMKAGKLYAPPAQKTCIYFIDDLNMHMIDTYGTQSPMTLLRQHLDYSHLYDRVSITIKEVKIVNNVTCMNTSSSSFRVSLLCQAS